MACSKNSSGLSPDFLKTAPSRTTPTLVRVGVKGITQNQRSMARTIRVSVPSRPSARVIPS
jgi:hypothetical protein